MYPKAIRETKASKLAPLRGVASLQVSPEVQYSRSELRPLNPGRGFQPRPFKT